jgi:hypothetical protein
MRVECDDRKSDFDFYYNNGCVCISCVNSHFTTSNGVIDTDCCVSIKKGIYVGQTRLIMSDGGLLSKQFFGLGTFSYAKGDHLTGKIYMGNFFQGQKCGFGVLILHDVVIFRGHWLNDKRHGYGMSYSNSGKFVHRGEWSEGIRCPKNKAI